MDKQKNYKIDNDITKAISSFANHLIGEQISAFHTDISRLKSCKDSIFAESLERDIKEKGLDVNGKDKNGDTPLLVAIKYDLQETFKMLLKNGADPFKKNDLNENAFVLAKYYRRDEINDLLKEYFIDRALRLIS
jgi:ankyrin repeat protein